MFEKIICGLLILAVLCGFAGCKKSNEKSPAESSAVSFSGDSKTESKKDYENNSNSESDFESISEPNSESEEVLDSETESKNESKLELREESNTKYKPKSNIVFKPEVLDDFGLTYQALTEKYGAETEVMKYDGGQHLRFKAHLKWGGMQFGGYETEDANYTLIKAEDTVSVLVVKANELFDNDKNKIYFYDLEKVLDCVIASGIDEITNEILVEFEYNDYKFKINSANYDYLVPNDIIYITK